MERMKITCMVCETVNTVVTNHVSDGQEVDCSNCQTFLGKWEEVSFDDDPRNRLKLVVNGCWFVPDAANAQIA